MRTFCENHRNFREKEKAHIHTYMCRGPFTECDDVEPDFTLHIVVGGLVQSWQISLP